MIHDFWAHACPRCGTPYPPTRDPYEHERWFMGHKCAKRKENR